MRGKKPNKVIENIEILDVAAGGKAIARYPAEVSADGNTSKGGMVIFVRGAVPGDCVDLEIYRKKKNYAEARVLRYHTYSEKREKPFCSHFGTCGGCTWQNLAYIQQIHYKQQEVTNAFVHIGKFTFEGNGNDRTFILPIIPSANQTYYRNKLEFAFSNKRWLTNDEIKNLPMYKGQGALGFHLSGYFDKVLDIDTCYLQSSQSNDIRKAIKKYSEDNHLSFYDFRAQQGFMRNIIIRNTTFGEIMVIVVFTHEDEQKRSGLLKFISDSFPYINSLQYIINPKKNDTIFDLPVHLYKGENFIYEKLDDLKYKISAKSFFQTNTEQALALYRAVKKFSGLTGKEIVYDLYTGTGSIANFVARDAKKVIGVEYISDAIEDANENSRLNGIVNTNFYAGDIKEILTDEFVRSHGKPELIITDPPRAGMDERVVKKILDIEPDRIVYVSCNPATQARDVAILAEKYLLKIIQPLDMFPHTHHVENVAVLEKIGLV